MDCDLTVCSIECTDVASDKMSKYLAHKLCLRKKLESKHKLEALSQSPVIDVAPAVSAVETSPAEAVVTVARAVDPPVSVATVQESPAFSDANIISHVESLFLSFAKSLEVRFSSIDERFSQVIGSSTSNDNVNRPIVSSQDVINPSFTAPSPVAVHPPAQASHVPCSDGLGKFHEGPAAVRSPVGVSSLNQLAFSDLVDRVRVYESSMSFAPDLYLDSARSSCIPMSLV